MPTDQHQPAGDSNADPSDDPTAHTPDEDGPHDVPDEKVIEKTLPSSPSRSERPGPR
ncbi:hypothetical protein [Ramlibacter sp.]|uniref:hypothetical protein n=1 Tax=Ramlibacter sp. TaxID=1917967 RepID=UPI002B99EA05|nr:hypothetical protein [Ramlibacter sp.]HWI81890.1 hypothetical protein [Ramlibacter sp.]